MNRLNGKLRRRSMPGKGPSRGRFRSGTADGGRQLRSQRCIVGLWRMLRAYL